MKKNNAYIVFALVLFILLTGIVLADSQNKIPASCKKECSAISMNNTKTCNNDVRLCNRQCGDERKACLNETQERYQVCKELCNEKSCPRNCAKIRIIESKECSKSQCMQYCKSVKINCTKKAENNLESCKEICEASPFEINKEECENSGGFFYRLCNGPYFDIVCSKEKYCICEGNKGYECPKNYSCSRDLDELTPRKKHTIEGYKDLIGNYLGEIGVCKKQ